MTVDRADPYELELRELAERYLLCPACISPAKLWNAGRSGVRLRCEYRPGGRAWDFRLRREERCGLVFGVTYAQLEAKRLRDQEVAR
jgi:hypothetical protein